MIVNLTHKLYWRAIGLALALMTVTSAIAAADDCGA